MGDFKSSLESKFDVGKFASGSLSLIGCEIIQDEEFTIYLSEEQLLSQLYSKVLLNSLQQKRNHVATAEQATEYRHVIGKMIYIGRTTAPFFLLHASMSTAKITDLHGRHIWSLESLIDRVKTQDATSHFTSLPRTHLRRSSSLLDIIYDVVMTSKRKCKGLESFIIFRRFWDIVHLIQWSAHHLCRVPRSRSTAKTLTTTDATSCGLYLKKISSTVHDSPKTELNVDSTAL